MTQVIRQVVLDREVSDAAPLQVLLEWSDGRGNGIPTSRYFVSSLKGEIVFLQPLVPGNLTSGAIKGQNRRSWWWSMLPPGAWR